MDITPLIDRDKKIILSYGSNLFKINDGNIFLSHIIISPNQVIDWEITDHANLATDDFSAIANYQKSDVVLIGTGHNHKILPVEIYEYFRTYNLTPEIMSSSAACRTYNILLTEGRNVSAFIMVIS